MLDTVTAAVTAWLERAGIAAVRDYPNTPLDRAAPIVCVTMKSGRLLSAGAGDYMGRQTLGGVSSEIYGFRAECVVGLEIYAPVGGRAGAAACSQTADAISATLGGLPSGLKLRALVCGSTDYDEKSDMFRCALELHALVYLIREENGETGEFTDFHLRGVIK